MDVLYKYCDRQRIDWILDKGELTFTAANELNDAVELTMEFSEIGRTERVEYLTFTKRIWDEMRCNASGTTLATERVKEGWDEEVTDVMWGWVADRLVFDMNAKAVEKVGVLSLSRKPLDALMWSHYCESWKGFVLGFDAEDPAIAGSRFSGPTGPLHINYSDARLTAGGPRTRERYERLILTKAKCWEYEGEVRCLRQIADGESRLLVPVCPESLVKIILGPRMPMTDVDRCLRLRDEKYPNAKLFVALPNPTTSQVDEVPLPPRPLLRLCLEPLDAGTSSWFRD